jgi:hypothetical protein
VKPIPTSYDGYRFRSRLEARWAVFFHTLQIDYRYEPEGWDLEGTWYQPDFWFPEQDCWIEVKPSRMLTEDEREKARLLALHSGKEVYILAGDAWLPPSYQAWRFVPPRIYTFPQGGSLEKEAYVIKTRPEIGIVLQQFLDNNIILSVQHGYVTLKMLHTSPVHEFGTSAYLYSLQQSTSTVLQLIPLLERYKEDLLLALTPEAGWQREIYGQTISPGFAWTECSACGQIALSVNRDEVDDEDVCTHQQCQHVQAGMYCTDTPRLRVAYQAARQERFSTEQPSIR